MTDQSDPNLTLRNAEFSDFFARATAKAILVLFIVFGATAIQSIRHGPNARYWLLLGGSLISGLAMLAFTMLIVRDAGRKQRGLLPMVVSFGALLPYVFGCYLTFYEGFWQLRVLLRRFSVGTVLVSFFFIVAGFLLVSAMYKLSEFGRAGDEGRATIQK